VAATGVIVYLSRDAAAATLRHVAALAPGSTLAATFMPPLSLVEPEERLRLEATVRLARAAGTPMVSFHTPAEMLALAREAGFREARHVSAASLAERYFAGRTDGLRPSSAEELLVATT
jgi:O-methyltransferase involved in polyketide biosynthesis